jgi:glycosyltransferase involved in cell wall biosynthesis
MAESRALAAADGVVTLTERIWPIIREWEGLRGRDLIHEVVPCCTDLELFKFQFGDRERRRKELGTDARFVLVYNGSIDGWYLTEEMADFFSELRRIRDDAHFLWLTRGRPGRIRSLMQRRGIAPQHYTVRAVASNEVPSYLCAADAGLAFIRPCFSKLASSPTKTAEYLACGLPLIMNSGIGDSDTLITKENVGVLVRDFNGPEYQKAIAVIEGFVNDVVQTRQRTREVAARLFDVRCVGIERYLSLYERVMSHATMHDRQKSFA